MAYYKPCKNCAVDKVSCLRRMELRDCISGQHVTTINFRCDLRRPLFRAGQRVRFVWTSWERNDFGEDDGLGVIFHGTVIEEVGLRFIVRVDDGLSACAEKIAARDVFKNESLVIKVKPSDMTALDEPDRALCPSCSAYEGEDARCLGLGDSFHIYWPDGCFKARKQAMAIKEEVA